MLLEGVVVVGALLQARRPFCCEVTEDVAAAT